MGLLRRIPTKSNAVHPFLLEVDFPTYETHLAALSLTMPSAATGLQPQHRLIGIQDRLNELRMILASSNVGNAWLQGEKGIGKTSVIEALLRARAEKKLSSQLLTRPFFIFDANKFFITTQRQDWVSSFDACLTAIGQRNGIVILDNADDFIHTADGEAGRLANTLISHLEHGSGLQAIMASPSDRTALINETSSGIARQFETMSMVKEPGSEDLRPMLTGHIARLEASYRVHYTPEAVDEIIRLLTRYPGRAFVAPRPANAVAFADKVGAYVRLNKYAEPPRVMELREQIGSRLDEMALLDDGKTGKTAERRSHLTAELDTLRQEYNEADTAYKEKFAPLLKAQASFELVDVQLAELRIKTDRTKDENETFNLLEKVWDGARKKFDELEKSLYPVPPEVTATHVRHVFNVESGIAIKSEAERVRRLDQVGTYLDSQIFLQDAPKAALAKAYISRELGVSDPSRPAAVFIFAGGTGLGKTELVRALARFDLGVENRPDLADNVEPVTVSMNLYASESSVSNLTGASRGLVGYDEEVPWLEAVRKNPRAFVLWDEANKAHPAMFTTTMQVLDTGKLTDSHGKDVNFRDTIICINLNGLTADDFGPGDLDNDEAIRAKLLDVVSLSEQAKEADGSRAKLFTKEFIGRVDGVFVFDKLGEPELVRIFRNQQIRRINQDYSAKGVSVEADEDTCKAVLRRFNAAQNGGRGPRQVANKLIRPLVTETLLVRAKAAIEAGSLDELSPQKLRLGFDGQKITLIPEDGAGDTQPEIAAARLPAPALVRKAF